MKFQITANPHMLLETVELLFAHINETPAEALTASGAYCLPVETVRSILQEVCGDIPRDDPEMRYYFESYTLPEASRRKTCIARHLSYFYLFPSSGSLAEDCRHLRQTVCQHGLSRSIVCFEDFSPRHEDSDEDSGGNLLQSIANLGLDEGYTRKLLEQFSDYDAAIRRLEKLIAPVAEKLEPLIRPWSGKAEPLAEAWRKELSTPEAAERFLRRICFKNDEQIEDLFMQFRYLRPREGPGLVTDMEWPYIFLHMGVNQQVGSLASDQFLPWEFEAMHLLGNPVRLQILHALWDKPMTTRELARALNLNLGNLCRDISNMCDSRLLVLETIKDRARYRTNREVLKILGDHLARIGTLQLNRP